MDVLLISRMLSTSIVTRCFSPFANVCCCTHSRYFTNFTLVARDYYGNLAAPSADFPLIDVYVLPASPLTGLTSGQLLNGSAAIAAIAARALATWTRGGVNTGLVIQVIDLKNGNYEIDYMVRTAWSARVCSIGSDQSGSSRSLCTPVRVRDASARGSLTLPAKM
jgi:hypothetical protein